MVMILRGVDGDNLEGVMISGWLFLSQGLM